MMVMIMMMMICWLWWSYCHDDLSTIMMWRWYDDGNDASMIMILILVMMLQWWWLWYDDNAYDFIMTSYQAIYFLTIHGQFLYTVKSSFIFTFLVYIIIQHLFLTFTGMTKKHEQVLLSSVCMLRIEISFYPQHTNRIQYVNSLAIRWRSTVTIVMGDNVMNSSGLWSTGIYL